MDTPKLSGVDYSNIAEGIRDVLDDKILEAVKVRDYAKVEYCAKLLNRLSKVVEELQLTKTVLSNAGPSAQSRILIHRSTELLTTLNHIRQKARQQ